MKLVYKIALFVVIAFIIYWAYMWFTQPQYESIDWLDAKATIRHKGNILKIQGDFVTGYAPQPAIGVVSGGYSIAFSEDNQSIVFKYHGKLFKTIYAPKK